MIRTALVLLALTAIIVSVLALQGDPGSVQVIWRPWTMQVTAAMGVFLLIAFCLAFALIWRMVFWLIETPARLARGKVQTRRRQAIEALAAGFTAAAAGDAAAARRQTDRAQSLTDELAPLINHLISQITEPELPSPLTVPVQASTPAADPAR